MASGCGNGTGSSSATATGSSGSNGSIDIVTPRDPSTHVSPSLAMTAPGTPSPQHPSATYTGSGDEAMLAEAVGQLTTPREASDGGELTSAVCSGAGGNVSASNGDNGVNSVSKEERSPSPRYNMHHLLQPTTTAAHGLLHTTGHTLKTENL